jgi:GNAT superfamily N-acetyltransferase
MIRGRLRAGLFHEDNMTIRLRTAHARDREIVIEFIHRLNAFEAAIQDDRKQDYGSARGYYDELTYRLSRSNGRLILAVADEGPVALMGFSIDEDAAYITDDRRRHGTVTDLIVDDGWRGQGVGRMLLDEAERITREAGLHRLTIGVLDSNTRARRTYEAFGFRSYVSILTKDF